MAVKFNAGDVLMVQEFFVLKVTEYFLWLTNIGLGHQRQDIEIHMP